MLKLKPLLFIGLAGMTLLVVLKWNFAGRTPTVLEGAWVSPRLYWIFTDGKLLSASRAQAATQHLTWRVYRCSLDGNNLQLAVQDEEGYASNVFSTSVTFKDDEKSFTLSSGVPGLEDRDFERASVRVDMRKSILERYEFCDQQFGSLR